MKKTKREAMRDIDPSRFWEKVSIAAPNLCWEWQGWKKKGKVVYGIFNQGSQRLLAHRAAYFTSKGEIPDGLMVCHSCDNGICCNPSHLWLGTAADNNADRHSKGRTVIVLWKNGLRTNSSKGEARPAAKLTDDIVRSIRKDSRATKVIAREMGVWPSTIRDVRKGKSWTHVV